MNRKVNVNSKNQTVDKILNKVFAGTDNTYVINDRQIFISKKSDLPRNPSTTQQRNLIKGKVLDENDEPLPGAAILVVGSTRGVTTDIDGSFEIEVGATEKLTISYLGMQDQIITVGNQRTLVVKLKAKADELDEVTVVAFGKQKKESVIGAITSVTVSDLKVPVGKISTSLAGQMAGIVAVQRSGEPGSGADFWIRGVNTFGANNRPLVLVDGIERPLDLVDTEDIETFSILKDATATAVYGVRGANGVVLVTTSKGNFENHRYYDIRTWMIAPQESNGPRFGRELRAKNFEDSWKRTSEICSPIVFEPKHYFFPIHQNQLNEMKNITQNYGW